jgi:hypothetical protein
MPTTFSPAVHGVTMSEALREAATYAPVDRVVMATYEFVHSSFSTRALVVAEHSDLLAKDEDGIDCTFKALAGLRSEGFEESDQAATPTLRLQMDGVSSILIDKLDQALLSLEPVWVIERVYVSDDLTTPALLPPARAIVRSGTVTETRVSLEVGFGDPANQPFPRKVYTRAQYPGLAVQ